MLIFGLKNLPVVSTYVQVLFILMSCLRSNWPVRHHIYTKNIQIYNYDGIRDFLFI
jgi:hypothetical protein